MTVISQITGSSWPTSGAATTGTSGLSAITGLTHVGSTDVPQGSGATGYLLGADDAAASLRIDTLSGLSSTRGEYYVQGWAMLERTATALAAQGTAIQFHAIVDSGTKLRAYLYVQNSASQPGLSPTAQNIIGGGNADALIGLGSSTGYSIIAFARWFQWGVRFVKDASAGRYELFINGVLVYVWSNVNTAGLTGTALDGQWTIGGGSAAGLRWRFCAPLASYDTLPAVRPLYGLTDSTAMVTRCMPAGLLSPGSGTAGQFWQTAGTATAVSTSYTNTGSNPARHRLVFTGAAGATLSAISVDEFGALSYDEMGWCGFVLPDVFARGSGATGKIEFLAPGGASALLTLDIVSGKIQRSGTDILPWTQADHYQAAVCFGSAGGVKLVINDGSANNLSQNGGTADLGSWTPGAMGAVRFSGVLGSDALSMEWGGVHMCRVWDAVGVDSLTQVGASGVSPILAIPNHVAAAYGPTYEPYLVPDAVWANRSYGLPRRFALMIVGRSGHTQAVFRANVIAYWQHARACELVLVDFFSINDINQINNNDPSTITSQLDTDTRAIVDVMQAGGNRVWLCTGIPRVQTGTGSDYVANELAGMDTRNNGIRQIVREKGNGRLRFSDVAAIDTNYGQYFTVLDATHFVSPAGDALYARYMAQTAVIGLIGAATLTDGADALSASGTVTGTGLVTGDATLLDADDVFSASGTVATITSPGATPVATSPGGQPRLAMGIDQTLQLTLVDRQGRQVDVSDAGVIQVRLARIDRSTRIGGTYIAQPNAIGADWSAGIVPVVVLGDDTADGPTRVLAQVRVLGGANAGGYESEVAMAGIRMAP